jgi:hypothetical protein
MRMNDTFLANGSLTRSDTTSRSHVLRFALFLRWVPALVPLAQVRSLHSAGTREQCTLLIRFSMRPIEIL